MKFNQLLILKAAIDKINLAATSTKDGLQLIKLRNFLEAQWKDMEELRDAVLKEADVDFEPELGRMNLEGKSDEEIVAMNKRIFDLMNQEVPTSPVTFESDEKVFSFFKESPAEVVSIAIDYLSAESLETA